MISYIFVVLALLSFALAAPGPNAAGYEGGYFGGEGFGGYGGYGGGYGGGFGGYGGYEGGYGGGYGREYWGR